MTNDDDTLERLIAYARERSLDKRTPKGRRHAWARRLAYLISQRSPERVAEMEREQGLR